MQLTFFTWLQRKLHKYFAYIHIHWSVNNYAESAAVAVLADIGDRMLEIRIKHAGHGDQKLTCERMRSVYRLVYIYRVYIHSEVLLTFGQQNLRGVPLQANRSASGNLHATNVASAESPLIRELKIIIIISQIFWKWIKGSRTTEYVYCGHIQFTVTRTGEYDYFS